MTRLSVRMITAFISIRTISPFSIVKRSLTSRLFPAPSLCMENIHRSWTLEEDKLLYENRSESLSKLASLLGRGLRGVQARLDKLQDTNSLAYSRLFIDSTRDKKTEPDFNKKMKLATAIEVLRRIRWDHNLDSTDFSVLYFDRLEETILESRFDAVNQSVDGKEDLFVFAIPEHRIMMIKYKERVVWDRNRRIDFVFGSMDGQGETIQTVVQTYSEWKRIHDEAEAARAARQADLSEQILNILGDATFQELKSISSLILQEAQSLAPIAEHRIHDYCRQSLSLFRSKIYSEDPKRHDLDSSNNKVNYIEAVDAFSNLVSFMPSETLRERILSRLQLELDKVSYRPISNIKENIYELPELNEDELTEKFVKGGGAGGQKINKTSNKVILVHEPTQIRIECQETRSLQQNRKIARKKLQLKLDEYYHGSMSRTGQKIAIEAAKKAKACARNRVRQREKEKQKLESDPFVVPPIDEYT